MTATFARHQPAQSSPNGTGSLPRAAQAGRRDRTRIALGLVVIVLCVLATASLFSSANKRAQVLALRHAVPAGHTIASGDLASAGVSVGPDIRTMPASSLDRVVGRVAAVDLVPGSLLSPDDVSDAARVPIGVAIVGASLKAGQYPVSLAPGDEVRLVEIAAPSAVGESAAPLDRGRASVLDVSRSKDSPDALAVSLLVPTAAATTIAGDGSSGRLSLVVVAG
jgi:hypothetical protein